MTRSERRNLDTNEWEKPKPDPNVIAGERDYPPPSYLPTPQEIQEELILIQATWSDTERELRWKWAHMDTSLQDSAPKTHNEKLRI